MVALSQSTATMSQSVSATSCSTAKRAKAQQRSIELQHCKFQLDEPLVLPEVGTQDTGVLRLPDGTAVDIPWELSKQLCDALRQQSWAMGEELSVHPCVYSPESAKAFADALCSSTLHVTHRTLLPLACFADYVGCHLVLRKLMDFVVPQLVERLMPKKTAIAELYSLGCQGSADFASAVISGVLPCLTSMDGPMHGLLFALREGVIRIEALIDDDRFLLPTPLPAFQLLLDLLDPHGPVGDTACQAACAIWKAIAEHNHSWFHGPELWVANQAHDCLLKAHRELSFSDPAVAKLMLEMTDDLHTITYDGSSPVTVGQSGNHTLDEPLESLTQSLYHDRSTIQAVVFEDHAYHVQLDWDHRTYAWGIVISPGDVDADQAMCPDGGQDLVFTVYAVKFNDRTGISVRTLDVQPTPEDALDQPGRRLYRLGVVSKWLEQEITSRGRFMLGMRVSRRADT